MATPIEDPIAVRELDATSPDHGPFVVRVTVGRPRRDARFGEDLVCDYLIEGLGDEVVRSVPGIDGVQALVDALKKIGLVLRHHSQGVTQLTWLEDDDLGFP